MTKLSRNYREDANTSNLINISEASIQAFHHGVQLFDSQGHNVGPFKIEQKSFEEESASVCDI